MLDIGQQVYSLFLLGPRLCIISTAIYGEYRVECSGLHKQWAQRDVFRIRRTVNQIEPFGTGILKRVILNSMEWLCLVLVIYQRSIERTYVRPVGNVVRPGPHRSQLPVERVQQTRAVAAKRLQFVVSEIEDLLNIHCNQDALYRQQIG